MVESLRGVTLDLPPEPEPVKAAVGVDLEPEPVAEEVAVAPESTEPVYPAEHEETPHDA